LFLWPLDVCYGKIGLKMTTRGQLRDQKVKNMGELEASNNFRGTTNQLQHKLPVRNCGTLYSIEKDRTVFVDHDLVARFDGAERPPAQSNLFIANLNRSPIRKGPVSVLVMPGVGPSVSLRKLNCDVVRSVFPGASGSAPSQQDHP
jgi:hypothetical protein